MKELAKIFGVAVIAVVAMEAVDVHTPIKWKNLIAGGE